MSFAIIETGGKQYKVSASKILEIEKLNAKVGETVKFKNVLLLNDDKTTEIGSPSISGASVEANSLLFAGYYVFPQSYCPIEIQISLAC